MLDVSGKIILALLGRSDTAEDRVSEDEIHHVVKEAESAGVLEPGEREMIAGVMRLGDRPVGAVMTPRGDVDAIDLKDSPAAIREMLLKVCIPAGRCRTAIATARSVSCRQRTSWPPT